MTKTDELTLAAEFPQATYEDWRRLVDGVLKGAPFEKLVSKTSDGLKIDPIYPRAKGAAPVDRIDLQPVGQIGRAHV